MTEKRYGGIQYNFDADISNDDIIISQSIMAIRGVNENYEYRTWTVYGYSKYFECVEEGCHYPIYTFEIYPDRYEWSLSGKIIHSVKKESA